MRRKSVVLVLVTLVVAALGYGIYYVSPYGRHDRAAAAYAQQFRARVLSVGGVTVLNSSHEVSYSRLSAGGECWFFATVEIRTRQSQRAFSAGLDKVLDSDDYLYEKVTKVGGSDSGAGVLLRIKVGTLGDGGSWDIRCG